LNRIQRFVSQLGEKPLKRFLKKILAETILAINREANDRNVLCGLNGILLGLRDIGVDCEL